MPRAEDNPNPSEDGFRALIEHSSDVTTLVDAEGRIVYASPSTRQVAGYDPGEILGKSPLDYIHPDDAPLFAGVLERLLAEEGSSVPALYRGRHADGSWRWIDGVATNLLHVPGVRAIVASYRDVTARVNAENALRDSEERYRLLFDATPLPIFVFDAESLRYVAVNDAALRKYGYSREELWAMTVLDIRPPEDVPRLRAVLASIDSPANQNTGSWRHRKKDGTTFEVEITTHAVEFAGRPARLVVVTDVTERRRVDEQLRQSQRMEAAGQLAGGVAHDFNNLLGVVLGSNELARRAARSGLPVATYLAEIDAASRRAADLTRKLLAFSRRQVLEVRTLDVGEMVDDFLQLLRRVIGEDVELVVVRSREPLIVGADASQLEQVLLNLCTNARQAMPNGGRIVLETRRVRFDEADVQREPWAAVGDWAEVRLTDTGEGMDEATRARVFEPFFSTKPDGTGLGMAMVHGIVHQHRGLVHVESRPGGGTTVHLYLPIAREAVDAVPVPAPSNGTLIRGGPETLLVAEDEAPLRGLLALTLAELGYDVITASDGEEAARTFAEQHGRISLAILDVVMPHLGGVQAFERMRALDPALKVIFITGYAPQHAQVSRILENGGHALLHKPFALKELGHKVRETLDGRA